MGKSVEVYPRAGKTPHTAPVWQYDYGQIIHINGIDLPASYKAEFSNATRGDAIATVQTTDEITIPAQYLESGAAVYIWLVVVDEQSRTTEYALIVPVAARAKPTDEEPAPEEQSEIDQTLAALNGAVADVQEIADAIPDAINDALEAAKESGEFDGEDGISPTVTITEITGGHRITIIDKVHPNGQVVDVLDGTNGRGIVSVEKTGTSGLTDTYTITYTSGDPTTFTVVNGKDGQDAISPEITVASITGGHRITITDANGTHTVDVLDGENGDAGRGIVSVQKTGTAGLVDTYTITYTDNTTSTFTVTNGKNGTDGISPSITVTDITGGHRVTITDATGQHSFDVMDGEDGQGAVQDVQVNGTSILDAQGVANVPVGANSTLGLVIPNVETGVFSDATGKLYISKASDAQIKSGANVYRAISPNKTDLVSFYGLAKAAGADMASSSNPVGTYTDAAKVAIQKMLGIYKAPYRLIKEITITEETLEVVVNTDINGDPISLSDAIVYAKNIVGTGSSNCLVLVNGDNYLGKHVTMNNLFSGSAKTGVAWLRTDGGRFFAESAVGYTNTYVASGLVRNLNATGILECSSITAIQLGSANSHKFTSGTITIYGR